MHRINGKSVRWSGLALGALGLVALVAVGCSTQVEWLATRFDPCGTILANCAPGSFQLQFADGIPDYRVDPTCTIPGACADGDFESPFDNLGPGFDGP